MKHNLIPFTPTNIQSFFTCPYQYFGKFIAKETKYTETPHTKFGKEVHKNIEDYLNGDAQLSSYLEPMREMLDSAKPVMIGAETKMAITKWNTLCRSFFDKDAYLRCIVDLVLGNEDHTKIIAFDWKTGKKSDAQVQHDVIKRCLNIKYPKADIVTIFLYIVKDDVDIQIYQNGQNLLDLDNKIAKIEAAHRTGEFPYNPNGLCKKWCDVLSCPHNGKNDE